MRRKSVSELFGESFKSLSGNLGQTVGYLLLVGVMTYMIAMVCSMILVMNLGVDKLLEMSENLTLNNVNEMILIYNDMLSAPSMKVLVYVLDFIMSVLISIVYTGYKRVCLNASRGIKSKASDLFYVFKNNPDKVIVISTLLWAASQLGRIPQSIVDKSISLDGQQITNMGGYFAGYVLMVVTFFIYMAVKIWMFPSYYLYIDDSEKDIIDLIRESKQMMKGQVIRYVLILILSALIMVVAAFFTCGIGLIFVIPFCEMIMAVYYKDLKGEYEDGHSNEADFGIEG